METLSLSNYAQLSLGKRLAVQEAVEEPDVIIHSPQDVTFQGQVIIFFWKTHVPSFYLLLEPKQISFSSAFPFLLTFLATCDKISQSVGFSTSGFVFNVYSPKFV